MILVRLIVWDGTITCVYADATSDNFSYKQELYYFCTQESVIMENQLKFKSIIPIQVRFSDVDMLGHVSNTVYQNYYDAGKLHYFDEVLPQLDFINIGLVGAAIKIDYLKPIFIKTSILVETHVIRIGNKSLTMEHQLVEEHSGEVLSTCTVVLVCYDIKGKKSIPVPEKWKEQIKRYDLQVIIK